MLSNASIVSAGGGCCRLTWWWENEGDGGRTGKERGANVRINLFYSGLGAQPRNFAMLHTHLVKKATRLRHDVTQAEKVGTGAAWWVGGWWRVGGGG